MPKPVNRGDAEATQIADDYATIRARMQAIRCEEGRDTASGDPGPASPVDFCIVAHLDGHLAIRRVPKRDASLEQD